MKTLAFYRALPCVAAMLLLPDVALAQDTQEKDVREGDYLTVGVGAIYGPS